MTSTTSGVKLTTPFQVDEAASRIAEMWTQYNNARRLALDLGKEAREYVFATDIDNTSANILPHKNRTHQPKLTQISDNLQSQYFEASLGSSKFFVYKSEDPKKAKAARKVEAWVRTKLEQRKFRETTGRALIADYVNYGNCFARVDFVVEKDDNGEVIYKGPDILRVSPMDMVFNNQSVSFQKAAKVQRTYIHISDVAELTEKHPDAGFDEAAIKDAMSSRSIEYVEDWVETIKQQGIAVDGFTDYNEYLRSGMVELLIYRGDHYNPVTNEHKKNRIIYVIDRAHIIRNEPNDVGGPFDGMHHAGWRLRNDNLWAQGPLDNIIGMQYRVDHLENLKADIFDHYVHPQIVLTGDDIQEPDDPTKPGNVWHAGVDSTVEFERPDASVLNVDTQIAIYHRLMEEFAGAPPESRGIRTPGEKTAFEVSKLDSNATKMFVDKARNFELMIETMLAEIFLIMMRNFNGTDFIEIFDDLTSAAELEEISREDIQVLGTFKAIGARHWERRNRESLELKSFADLIAQDPQGMALHISKLRLAQLFERKLNLEDEKLVEENIGAKETTAAQIIAEQYAAELSQGSNEPTKALPVGDEGGPAGPNQGTAQGGQV